MKNLKQKKVFLVLIAVVTLGIVGYFAAKDPNQKRKISSVTDDTHAETVRPSVLDSINFTWQNTENGLIMKISDNDGKLCEKWSSLQVVFKAEGLAYSGEVDRVMQSSSCEEGKFQQTWFPNLTEVEGQEFTKTGVFGEEPPLWIMEQVRLQGAAGEQTLSFDEIRQQYGSVPTLKPQ